MMSSPDLHYVVRYCSGSVIGIYAVVVILALCGPILFMFTRRYLCCRRQIGIRWSYTVQVQSYVFMLSWSD